MFNDFEVNTDSKGKIDHGKRNCKLFMIGTFIWILILVLVWNMKLGRFGPIPIWVDTIAYALLALLVSDIIVMAYIYKNYFGRNLGWEAVDASETEEIFDYDSKKHKYQKKSHN